MSEGEDIREHTPLIEEDAARANHYALIGRLFHDAPDATLIERLCDANVGTGEGEGTALERAWRALQQACGAASPAVVKQEYETLFLGVGKAEVTPYTSHWVRGIAPDRHLVELREHLKRLGLGRRSAAFEVEDHVSGVCDAMRVLIEDAHPLSEQRLFFNQFVYPGFSPFYAAVAIATSAVFYRRVAEFATLFLELERDAFDMDEVDN